jgi:hypothetical protein
MSTTVTVISPPPVPQDTRVKIEMTLTVREAAILLAILNKTNGVTFSDPESLSRWRANIHGHLHANEVRWMAPGSTVQPDPRYLCVSVEHADFAPILLEDALARIDSRQGRQP